MPMTYATLEQEYNDVCLENIRLKAVNIELVENINYLINALKIYGNYKEMINIKCVIDDIKKCLTKHGGTQ